MNAPSREAILLIGTCNGARFLAEQMQSILTQGHEDLHIMLRDDDSEDATPELLSDLQRQHANIEVITDDRGRLGYAQNFSLLMREASRRKPKYVLLSDQDDIWHPQRLSRQLATLHRMEQEIGAYTPCLAHSDLQLIDEQGQLIADSLFREQGIRIPGPEQSLPQLLAANYVTGCTIAINRTLLELATPVPAVIRHHDHWLALCAAACGRIDSETEPLVRYRQHGNNLIGGFKLLRSLQTNPSRLIAKTLQHLDYMQQMPELLQTLRQRCGTHASPQAIRLLAQAERATSSGSTRISRYRELERLGIKPSGLGRSILWLMKNLLG